MTNIQEQFSEDKINSKEIQPLLAIIEKENLSENENEVKQNISKLQETFKDNINFAQVFVSSPKFNTKKGLIEVLIDLFLNFENFKDDSKTLLKFLIESIDFKKKYYDYVYFEIGKEHRNNSLTSQKLLNYIKLLLLFYGKDIESKDNQDKYLFFLNPKESLLKTNISKENKLYLRTTFSIFLSFAIYKESDNEESDLIDFEFDNKHHLKIKLEKNFIKVKCDETYCSESTIEIKQDEYNKWISLQLVITDNKETKIHLIKLKQNINTEKEEEKEKERIKKEEEEKIIKEKELNKKKEIEQKERRERLEKRKKENEERALRRKEQREKREREEKLRKEKLEEEKKIKLEREKRLKEEREKYLQKRREERQKLREENIQKIKKEKEEKEKREKEEKEKKEKEEKERKEKEKKEKEEKEKKEKEEKEKREKEEKEKEEKEKKEKEEKEKREKEEKERKEKEEKEKKEKERKEKEEKERREKEKKEKENKENNINEIINPHSEKSNNTFSSTQNSYEKNKNDSYKLKEKEIKEEDLIQNNLQNKEKETENEIKNIKLSSENEEKLRNLKQRIQKKLQILKIPQFNLNDYKIKGKLGEGSYGSIYKVIDSNNNIFAMKKILAYDIEEVEDFITEYEIVSSCHHKHIMKIYSLCVSILDPTTFTVYILMEIANSDWEKEIKLRLEKKLYYKEEELISIMKQLVSALVFMERDMKIAHRDLKPENILIFNNNLFKVGDFGEAKEIKIPKQLNTLRGTELYMSPILYDGLKLDKDDVTHNPYKSDVFSLGFCFMYSAALNFNIMYEVRNVSDMKKMEHILFKYLGNKYSEKFIKCISKMLEFDEAKRIDFLALDTFIKENFPSENKN